MRKLCDFVESYEQINWRMKSIPFLCSQRYTDSTGHCKTVLNNSGFCQLFNTRPPSPLCHHVIISSTSSLPCLLPSPNRHITKHTQWHCAFSHHHVWHSMRRHPLPSLFPSAHIWCVGWRRAPFSDWAIYHVVKRRQRRSTLKVSRRWRERELPLCPGCRRPWAPFRVSRVSQRFGI